MPADSFKTHTTERLSWGSLGELLIGRPRMYANKTNAVMLSETWSSGYPAQPMESQKRYELL